MPNSLYPDQGRHYVGPDLAPNCLQKLTADDKSRRCKDRVNTNKTSSKNMISSFTEAEKLSKCSNLWHFLGVWFIPKFNHPYKPSISANSVEPDQTPQNTTFT